ncbi:MAG: ABC transporter permease [Ruminiclostridium sp.]|nr:ABC transporter permease [Ruminiclostridium sp.]
MKDYQKTLKVTWFGIKSCKSLLALMLLICCFFIPAFIYLILNEAEEELFINGYIMSNIGIFTAYAGGIFTPIMLFSYLHNRTEQDFYSAMPVKRIQYFSGYFLAGLITFLIPHTLMFIVCGFLPNNGLWSGYLKPVGMFFVLYCSITLCMMFCTSKAGAAVTFVLRNGLAASLVVLPFVLASLDSNAYFDLLSDKILMFTPIGTGFTVYKDYEHVLIVQLVIAVLELAASYLLYVKRRNETSLALAFPKTRYLFQYAVMTVIALYVAAFFSLLFGLNTDYFTEEGLTFTIFFVVVFSFIVFVILNMILEKNSKAAFHKIRHLFIFLGGFGLITSVTVSLLIANVPYSVLPFTPKFAVVYVYNVEEVYVGQDFDYSKDFDFSVDVEREVAWTDEDGTQHLETEYRSTYCKVKSNKAFIVTDPEKLRALTSYAQSRPNLNRHLGNIALLPCNSGWYSYSSSIKFEKEIPSDFMAFRVEFYNANVKFGDTITQEALDELTTTHYLSGTYRESTRYGFGRGESYISGFADVTVKY